METRPEAAVKQTQQTATRAGQPHAWKESLMAKADVHAMPDGERVDVVMGSDVVAAEVALEATLPVDEEVVPMLHVL